MSYDQIKGKHLWEVQGSVKAKSGYVENKKFMVACDTLRGALMASEANYPEITVYSIKHVDKVNIIWGELGD